MVGVPIYLFLSLLVASGLSTIANKYVNEFAVHVEGGIAAVKALTDRYGLHVLSPMGSIPDHYIVERKLKIRTDGPKPVYKNRMIGFDNTFMQEDSVKYMKQQTLSNPVKKSKFNDPVSEDMWYARDVNVNVNVIKAWEAGWTGRGVVIAVVDDGLEQSHRDFSINYDSSASFDYISHDSDPSPGSPEDTHGTSCAGVIAAEANNAFCTVGIAYRSRIGGIRVINEYTTDANEGAALSYEPQHIDIYSNGWGPSDDGDTFQRPGHFAARALAEGASKGRRGKGSIYVWPAGNGGHRGDACGADGYVNSIYTIAISAVTSNGLQARYGEQCSAILAATLSSGHFALAEKDISTTAINDSCRHDFGGTSAAVSIASGIIALALEVNDGLTWRDVQHLIVQSSRFDNTRDGEWFVNGAGRYVSHKYGFGLMNAAKMIQLAMNWQTVATHAHRVYEKASLNEILGYARIYEIFEVPKSTTSNGEFLLEHVVLTVTLDCDDRNDLEISVTSPMATRSIMLHRRRDSFNSGILQDWSFMSVHFWGETPNGTWIVDIINHGSSENIGTIGNMALTFYGYETPDVGSLAGAHRFSVTIYIIICFVCTISDII